MKLYYSPGSCSLAIRILLHEIKASFESEAVNLATKKTEHDQDYYKINSKGSVPALKLDNGYVLTENAVIHQYIADSHHQTKLLPAVGDLKRYQVLEWLNYVTTDMHKSCSPLFNAKVDQAAKENVFKPIIRQRLDFLNKHFATHDFLMGADYTLPDGYLFVVLSWLPKLGFDLSQWPNVAKFSQKVSERPAVQVALKEENLLKV